jgi:hypothetical protein
MNTSEQLDALKIAPYGSSQGAGSPGALMHGPTQGGTRERDLDLEYREQPSSDVA